MPVENRGFTSFRWMWVHPEAVPLRRAQNLPVYVLRPDGALKQYNNGVLRPDGAPKQFNDGPMSVSIRGYPQEAGERRVTA